MALAWGGVVLELEEIVEDIDCFEFEEEKCSN